MSKRNNYNNNYNGNDGGNGYDEIMAAPTQAPQNQNQYQRPAAADRFERLSDNLMGIQPYAAGYCFTTEQLEDTILMILRNSFHIYEADRIIFKPKYDENKELAGFFSSLYLNTQITKRTGNQNIWVKNEARSSADGRFSLEFHLMNQTSDSNFSWTDNFKKAIDLIAAVGDNGKIIINDFPNSPSVAVVEVDIFRMIALALAITDTDGNAANMDFAILHCEAMGNNNPAAATVYRLFVNKEYGGDNNNRRSNYNYAALDKQVLSNFDNHGRRRRY